MSKGQRAPPTVSLGRREIPAVAFVTSEPFAQIGLRPSNGGGGAVKESVAPIMRITDVDRAVEWYQRLGFGKAGEHRFEPDMPAYVFIARGDVWLHLSQHEGDARPGTLVYLLVEDVDAIANDFGVEVEDNPWGRDIVLRDPDGNRLRIGSPRPVSRAEGRISVDAVARELPAPWQPRDLVEVNFRASRPEGAPQWRSLHR